MIAEPTTRIFNDDLVVSSAGKDACRLAESYGYPSDPWQKKLVTDLLSIGEDGRYVASSFGFSAPRRSGKTHAIIILALYFLIIKEQSVIYTAHRSDSAAEVWKRLLETFEESDLSQFIKPNGVSRRVGHEHIELTSGAVFRIVARSTSGGAGRGSEADVLILDEAMDLPKETIADLRPTLRRSTNPLTIYLGTPSYSDRADGIPFAEFRRSILDGTNKRAGWWEYAAPVGADPEDREVWHATNPALAMGHFPESAIEDDLYSGMDTKQFLVETLGSWQRELRPTVVDMNALAELADAHTCIDPDSDVVVGLDTDPDSRMCSVVAVGLNVFKVPVIEVIEHGPGSTWAPTIIRGMFAKDPDHIRMFVMDKASELAHFAESLESDGIPVYQSDHAFMAMSCTVFSHGVEEGTFKHRNDPRLIQSVRDAATRPLWGQKAWKKADSTSDITVLVAACLALYGFSSEKAESKVSKPKTGGVWLNGQYYDKNS